MRHGGGRTTVARLGGDERGAVAVEFALIAPILFLIVFAVIDFGRALYTVNQLVTSVREGARYAAVRVTPDDVDFYADSVKSVVRNAAPSLAGGISSSQIDVSVDAGTGTVTVRVRDYPFDLITPLARTIVRSQLTFTKEATFRLERSGS